MLDLLLAVLLDWMLGDPPSWPHPVKWMGTLIAKEEALVRRVARSRRAMFFGGAMIVLCNLLFAFGLPFVVLHVLKKPFPVAYHALNIYLLYACLAARCLRDEAMKVAQAFEQGIEAARHRLAFIVGRDTAQLDESEIVRATVETVAENTSDGVIAPLFYAMIGVAPLAVAYKMVNTMDSMLGYLNAKYRDIGYVPAKMDDVWNFVPARLTSVLMLLGSLFRFDVKNGWRVMRRDRRNHKSPNCGYPESAVAGLLGVRLGGENVYFGERVWKPTIGDATRPLERADIARAVEIMFRAEIVGMALYLIIACILRRY
ncbi:cobalamin biosynthesis protein [Candidatus Moduliflexus flocculans]|uniref:Cobalamin biosynthesis protein CobD n=1 Tax=Candidatus Moduliflexus flocculans TaxID=1499966 RepID=A0A081BTM5_9BACT|nr:cobalamin biosynthesis protein [Candidatus Moduliflexus flocculans]